MATLSDWHNYDYNGVIFVFGRVNSSLTSSWKNVTKVTMSVDSSSNFVYEASIKDIPYTQLTNWDGTDCVNNTACKVFNINTFTHRTSSSTKYQFSGGTHTCYLRFYYSASSYVTASVSIEVHAKLSTPTLTFDAEKGIVNVSRSTTSGSPRYYIDIRRKDRNKVNPGISWVDKDYIHTVVMKGIEGGKYNEGIPHTGLMPRGSATISGSSFRVDNELPVSMASVESMASYSANDGIMLLSTDSTTPTTVTCDTDIPYTSSSRYNYYVFTAPAAATYQFTQTDGPDLRCRLYSDSGYSNQLASHGDIGDGNMSFNLVYALTKGQTVYIEIYDYSRDGQTINLRINTVVTQTVTSYTPYTIPAHGVMGLSYYSSSSGYVTLYPAKRANGLRVNTISKYGSKTPYYVLTVASGTNTYTVSNSSAEPITFWLTELHSDIDYQPYWRTNAISQFNACVVFDNAEIEAEYGEWCIAQVEDALTRLSSIISETSGNSIAFKIVNGGVSKLYVAETIESSTQSGRYISSNKITSNSSKTLYYAAVSKNSIYRVNYGHDVLYYATSIGTSTSVTTVSASSTYLWYEDIGGDYGADENTLVVRNTASGYYVLSNSPFTLERVLGTSDSSSAYNEAFSGTYNVTIRFGLDGTTWMGDQGIATSHNGGYSAYINGQGQWMNWLYYNSSYGVAWSYAIINVDNSDLFETLSHVIHEEIAQSLGIGDDCYSREESIHWDPEQANPDWYTGVDRTILDFAYDGDKNGYTQFDLCNEFDLPITLFKEYSNYNSTTKSYQFHLKDASGNWLLRSGEYEIRAWCVGQGANSGAVGGSGSDGWDDDPYSLWTEPVSFTVTGGWYWSDYSIDMENGSKKLKVSDVHHTIWNAFVDAVIEVMGSGTIPNNSTNYGSAANLSFADAINKAKLTDTEDGRTLYAQQFNIVNYIINSKVATNIGVKTSLTSQVLAEDLITLQDCRNQM